MKLIYTALIYTALTFIAFSHAAAAAEPAPSYEGQEQRMIKALAPSEIQGLLAGEGLGYAKSAELNRYPGPAHILELADQLQLSEAQLESTRMIHARMEEQAKALGARLVAAEAELEQLFRDEVASERSLGPVLDRIAGIQAELRGVHLLAHIEQRALLSPEQVTHYTRLRGYHAHHGTGKNGH